MTSQYLLGVGEELLPIPANGFSPCLLVCNPKATPPACAKVPIGVYIPSFKKAGKILVGVRTAVLESKFCFAINSKPLGFLMSRKYFPSLSTSLIELSTALRPPLTTKS